MYEDSVHYSLLNKEWNNSSKLQSEIASMKKMRFLLDKQRVRDEIMDKKDSLQGWLQDQKVMEIEKIKQIRKKNKVEKKIRSKHFLAMEEEKYLA